MNLNTSFLSSTPSLLLLTLLLETTIPGCWSWCLNARVIVIRWVCCCGSSVGPNGISIVRPLCSVWIHYSIKGNTFFCLSGNSKPILELLTTVNCLFLLLYSFLALAFFVTARKKYNLNPICFGGTACKELESNLIICQQNETIIFCIQF